jgi:hypothetical protein
VVSFSLWATRDVSIEISGEGGYAVLPVEGAGATITGGWISAQLGFGFVIPSPPARDSDDETPDEAAEEVE